MRDHVGSDQLDGPRQSGGINPQSRPFSHFPVFESEKNLRLDIAVGSPSRDGDGVVYVFDINQPSLSTLFF